MRSEEASTLASRAAGSYDSSMVNETPTDEVKPGAKAKKTKHPKRGIRKRVLGEGEGDYCIYEIAGQDRNLPKGSLLPLPEVPRFEDTVSALRWLRNKSGDTLAGKQLMVFKACEILNLRVQSKPTVIIETKPKLTVNDPSHAETSA